MIVSSARFRLQLHAHQGNEECHYGYRDNTKQATGHELCVVVLSMQAYPSLPRIPSCTSCRWIAVQARRKSTEMTGAVAGFTGNFQGLVRDRRALSARANMLRGR